MKNEADPGVLKDKIIKLQYGKNKGNVHKARRIAY